jgi:hypothetical protein
VFPAATVPPSFTIDSTALGAHGTTIDAYVTAYSFLDDGDVTPPPPSDTWMCVL